MRARVAERVKYAGDVRDSDLGAPHVERLHLTLFQIVCSTHYLELSHSSQFLSTSRPVTPLCVHPLCWLYPPRVDPPSKSTAAGSGRLTVNVIRITSCPQYVKYLPYLLYKLACPATLKQRMEGMN